MTEKQPLPSLDLKQKRFNMLADIAKDLAGDLCFPICLDLGIYIAGALKRPLADASALIHIIQTDPLLHLQLLRLANSPLYNHEQTKTLHLDEAIARIGLETARQAMLNLVSRQLFGLKDLARFGELASSLWAHSVSTAAAAHILASHFSRIPSHEAFLAGLIHDIGIFYMLFKANQYSELRSRPESLQYLIVQWHDSIGLSLTHALELPERIAEGIQEHDHPRPFIPTPRTLSEIVFVANILSDATYEWHRTEVPRDEQQRPELTHPPYVALLPQIAAFRKQLIADISA